MASVATMKTPPLFREDEMDYEQWKKDLTLWTLFTDLAKEKMAIAVHLSLCGRARQATSEISISEMKSANGMDILISKLDRVFLQDENWRCFNNYLAFENYRRDSEVKIDQYLSEFDRRHYKLKECGVDLPDAVVACRLIKSCNLSEVHFQLALSTTPTMTFENMRNTLKKLFAECGNNLNTTNRNIVVEASAGSEPGSVGEALYSERHGLGGGAYSARGQSYSRRRPDQGWQGPRRAAGNRRSNPVGRNGRVTTCNICGSIRHWARECPESFNSHREGNDNNYQNDEVHITLIATEHEFHNKMDTLMGESIGSVILDSGCSKTVCGETWLSSFLETLGLHERKSISVCSSSSVFKFGDGRKMKSLKCVTFPCNLAGKNIRIRTDVVSGSVPLLLSKTSMKRAGMIINLNDDTVQIFGTFVKLNTTSLGHYIMPLFRSPTPNVVNEILHSAGKSDCESIASKLHRQFAHPSSERLRKLLRTANRHDDDLHKAVDRVTENCDTCRRFKKPRSRPIVSMPLASSFNETVAMDLKSFNGVYFLVLVDVATRYCIATVIRNKAAETIIKALFACWITIFGAPSQFLSDNGGEFNNDIMRSLGDVYGIRLLCTAAESPWSNGICERLNAILGMSVQRVIDDTKCSTDVALAWSVAARNALQNFSGYSPNQLVFGRNPSLPNVMNNDPPALEGRTNSQVIADNLNAMHNARREFLRSESDNRVQRALLHQVRSDDVENLSTGEVVYFKRQDDRWHGPGVVIGRDGKQVLVKHGGTFVRVHTCRLQHATSGGATSLPVSFKETQKSMQGEKVPDTENLQSAEGEDEPSSDERITAPIVPVAESNASEFIVPSGEMRSPVLGKRIEYYDQHGDKNIAKVISRAGKSTGHYKYCYNIKKMDGEMQWIDLFRGVQRWRPVEDESEVLVTYTEDIVGQAKLREMSNWTANDVFQEVDDLGQRCISLRWIITEKFKDGNPLIKARLVARGFEEKLGNEFRKDSPTCTKDSLRITLSLVPSFGWKCNSIDIKAAFLQGKSIEREIFVRPPKEFDEGKLWKLKKNVYGLNDAARAWYFKVREVLVKLKMSVCSVDSALFYWLQGGELSGLICVHVDDIFWAGTETFRSCVIDALCRTFSVGSSSTGSFKYIGINIEECGNHIRLNQMDYIGSLEEITLGGQRASRRSDDLGGRESEQYQVLTGQLIWLAAQSRPDIAFDVCELSTHCHAAKVENILRANKVVTKVKNTPFSLTFPVLENVSHLTVECYSDASFGNLSDGGSQGSYLVFLVDHRGVRSVVSWQSRKVRRVVKSTLAAETLALLDGAEASILISNLVAELLALGNNQPIVKCYVDNKSLVEAVYSTKAIEDKHLRINMAVLRDMLARGDLHSVEWVQSSCQLADALTKRGASVSSLIAAISNED